MLTFMLHAHATSRLGLGGVGCVNVHVNLRHMHMLRHVLGCGGWGVLTFMLACVTCTCYVTSWVGGVGCVNVHVNLRHMHMLCHVLGWGGGGVC